MSALKLKTLTGVRSCRQSSGRKEGDQGKCVKLRRVPLGVDRKKRMWMKVAIIEEARAEVIKVMIQTGLFLLRAAGEVIVSSHININHDHF